MRQIALALSFALLSAAAAQAASLGVPLDQSVRLVLRVPARQVIVGNPAIADVTVADPHHLIITGKSGGVTNLIVTDMTGRAIFDRQLVVSSSTGDHVALINGPEVVSYACAPQCAIVGPGQSAAPVVASAPAAASGSSAAGSVAAPAPSSNTGAIQASPGTP